MIAIVAKRWGSTVQNLFDNDLKIGPVFLSNKTDSNYQNLYVTDDQAFIFSKCREEGVKIVALAGYLKKLNIPEDFSNRVVNLHPSLLPAFGGKGMYGINVHRAVIKAGVKITGCTIHFVDNDYDTGPMIAQYPVPVYPHDTPEKIESAVKKEESWFYPFILSKLCDRDVKVNGKIVDFDSNHWRI